MGIINVLDKHTANLIAAGEVVERPSSAIKELLENSADAGATQITVEIKNGGTTYIRVSDNGSGISAEDVPVCILRHATSKIRTKDDLAAISTLGFRGEALAAIAAVTRLRIITKRKDDQVGTYFATDFGEKKEISETGCPVGTTIIAENLFENVPARRKFLRKDVSEAKAVGAIAEKFALSKPHIALTFISDGVVRLKTPGDGNLKSCIYATLGKEFTDNMLSVNYTLGGIEISGYIGKPQIARPNRNFQNFFINERYIKSGTMTAGLEEGFKSFCPIGKFPACVLFMKIDFSQVDINIHPAKLEVKFTGERQVFETIMYAVRNALSMGMDSFAPTDTRNFIDDTERRAPDITINNSGRGNDTFIEAFPKPPEIIRNKGTVSVPYPESIEKIYGKDSDAFIKAEKSNHNIPDYAKIADTEKRTEKAPDEQKAESDKKEPALEFVQVKYEDIPGLRTFDKPTPPSSLEKRAMEVLGIKDISEFIRTPDETTEKEVEVAQTEQKNNYTAEEISLFESIPKKASDAYDVPFRESTDTDTAKELMERVSQGITVIGEAFNSYIIVQRDTTLYLIDKHAAHERIIYESLKKGKKEGGAQLLLMPLTVNVAAEESVALSENGEYLENIGFVFEEFGTNTYLIRGVPAEIDIETAEETFVYLCGQIAKAGGKAIGDIFDRALYTAACKAAVKAGTKTSKLSSTMIADILFSDEAVLYCPHGRPVLVEFTKSKLDKMFSRT